MTTTTTVAQYELTAARKGCVEVNEKLIVDESRKAQLPERPAEMRPLVGTYKRVADEAVRRNNFQIQSGFLDYLYAPEPYVSKGAKA